jgi:hypothetical protein
MADTVTPDERQNCWVVMAEVFVDSEVDYHHVAEQLTRHCPNLSIPELKDTFFHEVAPELVSNGMTPVPNVWLEFNSEDVIYGITKMLARRRTSLAYRLANDLWRMTCRWFAQGIWQKLERELLAVRQAGT